MATRYSLARFPPRGTMTRRPVFGALKGARMRIVSSRFTSILFASVVWVACNSAPLQPGPDINVGGATFSAGREVSADYVYNFTAPGPSGEPQFMLERAIYQYNPGGGQGFAWSFTSDGGNSWTNCNANSTCPVTKAPGQTAWAGDPVIAAAPRSWVTSVPSGAGVVV